MAHAPTSLSDFRASDIIGVPLAQASRIFSGTPAEIHRQWRELAAQCHPDRHSGATDANAAFRHLLDLRDAALGKADADAALLRDVTFATTDGRHFKLRYLRCRPFELGCVYIGRTTLAYAIDLAHRDLYEAATERIGSLTFANEALRRQFATSLPAILAWLETADRLVLILRRDPGLVVLADLLAHQGGQLDPRHIAWIVSGLANIACYLTASGLVHGAIDAGTVLVDPATHEVALPSGWFYATETGAALQALPEQTARRLPAMLLDHGLATPAIDLALIRALARTLCGDPSGSRMLHDGRLPRPFADWLTHAPADTAFADTAGWERARDASFGKQRFVDLPVTPAEIYPPLASL